MLFNVKVSKLNTVLAFDSEKLPVASVNYLIQYGLKQSLNDAHAGSPGRHYTDKTDQYIPDVRAAVEKREAQIRTGPGSRGLGHQPSPRGPGAGGHDRRANCRPDREARAKGRVRPRERGRECPQPCVAPRGRSDRLACSRS